VPSPADARTSLLKLTEEGHRAFAPLQQRSRDEAAALLAALPAGGQERLIEAMDTLQRLLDPDSLPERTIVLRDPRPGDMGWVVQQHGEIYAREYGWNSEFEALVAGIASQMLKKHDPAWERGWIAELNGERVGSVFVVRRSKTVAQLRLLILTPHARGLGLGMRLTDECLAFARAKGYRKMMLWTNSCLGAARGIYARRGFELVKSEPYRGYGQDLVSEIWELKL
jgi:GNAT superfamily N-acetyltransferase